MLKQVYPPYSNSLEDIKKKEIQDQPIKIQKHLINRIIIIYNQIQLNFIESSLRYQILICPIPLLYESLYKIEGYL